MASKCASGKTASRKCGTTKNKNTKAAAKPKAQTKRSCGTKKKQVSYGMKPYVVRLPNEPDPLARGRDEEYLFVFRGGNQADPRSYVNFKGISLFDNICKRHRSLKDDLINHSFRSKETFLNWCERNRVTVVETPEGLYYDWTACGTTDQRIATAQRHVRPHNGWAKGDVYAIAFKEDPSIPEPFGEITRIEHPRDLPQGAKYITVTDYKDRERPVKFYGDDADEYIRKEIRNAERPENRQFAFYGKASMDMGYDEAIAIRPDAKNLNINGEMYVSFTKGGIDYNGHIRRVK